MLPRNRWFIAASERHVEDNQTSTGAILNIDKAPTIEGAPTKVTCFNDLDIAGNPSLKRLRRALRPRGTAVFVGGEDAGALLGMGRQLRGVLLSGFLRQRLALLVAAERASDYERLTELIGAGEVVPSIDRTYPLEDAPLAVRQLEAGQVRGKVAITVDR